MTIKRRWRRLMAFLFGRRVSHYTKRCHCDECVDYRIERFIKRCVNNGVWSKKDAVMMAKVML